MPRYYFSENAGRPFAAGARVFEMNVTSIIGGTMQGVIEVADVDVELFVSVAGGKAEEITLEDYNKILEKKKPTPDYSRSPSSSKQPEYQIKGAGAVIVDGSTVAAQANKDDLPSDVDDVIALGVAAPPSTDLVPKKEKKGRGESHAVKRGTNL